MRECIAVLSVLPNLFSAVKGFLRCESRGAVSMGRSCLRPRSRCSAGPDPGAGCSGALREGCAFAFRLRLGNKVFVSAPLQSTDVTRRASWPQRRAVAFPRWPPAGSGGRGVCGVAAVLLAEMEPASERPLPSTAGPSLSPRRRSAPGAAQVGAGTEAWARGPRIYLLCILHAQSRASVFSVRVFATCFSRIRRYFLLEIPRDFLFKIIKTMHFAEGKSKYLKNKCVTSTICLTKQTSRDFFSFSHHLL